MFATVALHSIQTTVVLISFTQYFCVKNDEVHSFKCHFGGVLIGIVGQKMLGMGRWVIKNTQRCSNEDKMPWIFDARRYKVNRSHDALDVHLVLDDDLDYYGTRVYMCKIMDGGCKLYMTLTDDCLEKFVKRYAAENIKTAFELAGIYPPDFPIPKSGIREVNDERMPRTERNAAMAAVSIVASSKRPAAERSARLISPRFA